LSSEGVYDLAQSVLGYPFLYPENALSIVRDERSLVEELIPTAQTMREITVNVGSECKVSKSFSPLSCHSLKHVVSWMRG
jgi:chloride channel 3/4/5